MQNLRRVGKNSGVILSRLLAKVHDVSRRRRGPLAVSDLLIDRVYTMFRSKDIRRSLEIVEKSDYFFASNFLQKTTPTFLRQIVSAIYFPPFRKVWLNFVSEVWQYSRMQNLWRVSKNSGPILSRSWNKCHGILRRCRTDA